MSQTRAAIRESYPLPAYNFRVTVGAEVMSFTEVTGLSMKYESVTYRHGLSFLEGEGLLRFAYKQAQPVTMKKGVVPGRTQLYDWFVDGRPRSVVVGLCDETGSTLVEWSIAAAVPVKLDAPAFHAAANEVAVDTLEVLATGFSVRVVPPSS